MMETIRTPTRLPTGPTLARPPRTPPYTPPSKPRFQPVRSPLSAPAVSQSTEIPRTLPKNVAQPDCAPRGARDGITILELSENDPGYATDGDTVYPHSLEEAPSTVNSDNDDNDDNDDDDDDDDDAEHDDNDGDDVSSGDESTASDGSTSTATLLRDRFARLHCTDITNDRLHLAFEEIRRHRRMKKRHSVSAAGNFKRSHSQCVTSEPEDVDMDAQADHGFKSTQRRLRRRVRGPDTLAALLSGDGSSEAKKREIDAFVQFLSEASLPRPAPETAPLYSVTAMRGEDVSYPDVQSHWAKWMAEIGFDVMDLRDSGDEEGSEEGDVEDDADDDAADAEASDGDDNDSDDDEDSDNDDADDEDD